MKFIYNDNFADFGMDRECINGTVMVWLQNRYNEMYPVIKQEMDKYSPPETVALIDLFRFFTKKYDQS